MFPEAMCLGKPTEWWYPIRDGKTSEELSEISRNMKRAMKICRQCPEIVKCAKYSLDNNEVGIWGGMGEKTRKRARRMIRFGVPIETVVSGLVVGAKD